MAKPSLSGSLPKSTVDRSSAAARDTLQYCEAISLKGMNSTVVLTAVTHRLLPPSVLAKLEQRQSKRVEYGLATALDRRPFWGRAFH